MEKKHKTGIVWYRRDLRVSHHLGLLAAEEHCAEQLPVYFLSSWKSSHHWTGANRQQFLCESLASLDGNLRVYGGRLLIRSESAIEGIKRLIEQAGATFLSYQKDPDPFGQGMEAQVEQLCRSMGVEVHAYHDVSLHAPEEILTGGGLPYRVYTPYSKQWLAKEKPPRVKNVTALNTSAHHMSEELPSIGYWNLSDPAPLRLMGGEKAARERMKNAVAEVVEKYKDRRDLPAEQGTSRLSQDLRWGLISIRELYARVLQAENALPPALRDGCLTFRKELAWREFYFAILRFFPDVLEWEFSAQWRGLPWEHNEEFWQAWCCGTTGFPIVDAGMRELLATGHMHNRVRMIVAMFLTKDLHIDWRYGESWFMQHLLDGEIASNNGGWQWSAGTGADAAPYFRIQNPWSQTQRFDPKGIYIKRWIPELAHVPAEKLHEAPTNGLPLAKGYPLPIVDHRTERDRTLAIFKAHKAAIR